MSDIPWAAQEPWVAILVMMLSVGFWIVSSLIKALADPIKQARQAMAPPNGQGPVNLAPLSLEEFLQEARRRRGEADALIVVPTAADPVVLEPAPAGASPDTAKRRKAKKDRGAASAPLFVDVNLKSGQGPALPALPAVAALSANPEPLSIVEKSTLTGHKPIQHPFNLFLSQVLSDRRNIPATILLGEILGKPLCRKRRGLSSPPRPNQKTPE